MRIKSLSLLMFTIASLLVGLANAQSHELRFVRIEVLEAATGLPLPRSHAHHESVIYSVGRDGFVAVPIPIGDSVVVNVGHLGYQGTIVELTEETEFVRVLLRPHPGDPFLLLDRMGRNRPPAVESGLPIIDTPIEALPSSGGFGLLSDTAMPLTIGFCHTVRFKCRTRPPAGPGRS